MSARLALELLEAMQADMAKFLVLDNGCGTDWFVNRMIWHLDGPQQRAAQAALEADIAAQPVAPSPKVDWEHVARLLYSAYTPDGHLAPNECFATGPLTGSIDQDFLACPGCAAEHAYNEALSKALGERG
jgi:hypothetical protein